MFVSWAKEDEADGNRKEKREREETQAHSYASSAQRSRATCCQSGRLCLIKLFVYARWRSKPSSKEVARSSSQGSCLLLLIVTFGTLSAVQLVNYLATQNIWPESVVHACVYVPYVC